MVAHDDVMVIADREVTSNSMKLLMVCAKMGLIPLYIARFMGNMGYNLEISDMKHMEFHTNISWDISRRMKDHVDLGLPNPHKTDGLV